MNNGESGPEIPPEVQREFDDMYERMQTPEQQAAVDFLFNATPEEIQASIAKNRLRDAMFDGSVKADLDESVGYDPDLMP